MKAYFLQVLVIDHNHLGADEVERVLEDANYPNDCITPSVIKSQSVEIGDWNDNNPLNHSDTQVAEADRLFRQNLRPMEDVPNDEFVLLFGESGYSSTPLRCEVCKFYPDWGGWRTYSGDYFGGTGNPEPVGWLPLPSAR
jgi:hypothetical protein